MNPNGQPPQNPGGTPPQTPPPQGQFPPQQGNYYQPQQPSQQYSPQQPWGQAIPPTQAQQAAGHPPVDPHLIPPQQSQQYAIDYLDQIAPPPSGKKFLGGSFTWILIGLAVVFMIAVSIIAMGSGNSNTTSAQTAYLRYENLSKITLKYHKYLKSNTLSSTDSNLAIFMTNAKRDLVDPIAKNGTDVNKIDKELKAKETAISDKLTATIEDARLNAILDRVYAREMAYQTQQLLDLYKKMAQNRSKSIADNAQKAIPNLEPIHKAFDEFDSSTASPTALRLPSDSLGAQGLESRHLAIAHYK